VKKEAEVITGGRGGGADLLPSPVKLARGEDDFSGGGGFDREGLPCARGEERGGFVKIRGPREGEGTFLLTGIRSVKREIRLAAGVGL